MTPGVPPGVQELGRRLVAEAGTYLHNTIREPGVTCAVCAAPVDGHELCIPCNRHSHAGLSLADRVGPSVYAVEPDSQAYRVVRNYKAERPGPSHQRIMLGLLALGLRGHFSCAAKLSGVETHGWTVVPSARGRATLHTMVRSLSRHVDAEVDVAFVGDASNRELRPRQWSVRGVRPLPGHVVVVDDSWVTGAHAQGVAAALKSAGVHQVSIYVVARVLRPDWEPNEQFIKQRLARTTFDWARCPWTGAGCP